MDRKICRCVTRHNEQKVGVNMDRRKEENIHKIATGLEIAKSNYVDNLMLQVKINQKIWKNTYLFKKMLHIMIYITSIFVLNYVITLYFYENLMEILSDIYFLQRFEISYLVFLVTFLATLPLLIKILASRSIKGIQEERERLFQKLIKIENSVKYSDNLLVDVFGKARKESEQQNQKTKRLEQEKIEKKKRIRYTIGVMCNILIFSAYFYFLWFDDFLQLNRAFTRRTGAGVWDVLWHGRSFIQGFDWEAVVPLAVLGVVMGVISVLFAKKYEGGYIFITYTILIILVPVTHAVSSGFGFLAIPFIIDMLVSVLVLTPGMLLNMYSLGID